ncbi:hypothetical protein DM02DRAFT_635208 [Periconia macrospinosa]|uniref:Uncharacterized protein n=1 Tax=Periconia macrospinosa TaxID=97972 RepID=A0A2V1D3L4_9PLEO|nr:hypothetical protein DM02DRAFT_635208 [Periconia macrospinosa]
MKPKAIVSLTFLSALASASQLSARGTTCQEECYTAKPECKTGMFPLQSADGACWSCCISDETFCVQVCFNEPPTCDDGMAPTKNGECYTCCRASPLPSKTEIEPFPLPTVVPRSSEICDRQCADEPPACGDWVPFQPGGSIADEPEIEPKSLRPETCDRSCFDEPQECGEGMISWSDDGVCWFCCDDPTMEH